MNSKNKLVIALLAISLVQPSFNSFAKEKAKEVDTDLDGRIDTWNSYDSKGVLKASAKDSNKDGKPDQFKTLLKGRDLVLKEYDRNYDGKIDKRQLAQWDANKRLPIFTNNKLEHISAPGYITLWTEEDNDFDGKIDSYRERGNKSPSKSKIGMLMDDRHGIDQEK